MALPQQEKSNPMKNHVEIPSQDVAAPEVRQRSFTPGPWKEIAGHVFAPGQHGANICSVSELRATTTVGYTPVELGSKDFHEACANARLIAAAPELLAALKIASDHLHTALNDVHANKQASAILDAFDAINSAITKAEGRS